jgi:dolichol-phosphate mannosyltransferase
MALKTLVMIPTFNEVENVEKITRDILALKLPLDILFIDDNSPDGTGTLLEKLRETYPISVYHRSGKLGVGSAHKRGIEYAYRHGYQQLVTMDCDGTHDPADIPEFMRIAEMSDIVVGSRHLQGSSLEGWSLWRQFVTRVGHILTSTMLRMPFDATGAFRCYRLDRIPQNAFWKVKMDDYSFFFESLAILHENGFRIKEIPITLAERSAGHSKLRFSDLIASFIIMGKLRYCLWFDRGRLLVGKEITYETIETP